MVQYKGVLWLYVVHLVGIKVTYEGGPCTLFYDELVHGSMVTDTHDGQTIPAFEAREIDVATYRIISHFHFGWYHYTQLWTFKDTGTLYSELYIHPTSSNSCISQFRTYEPRWRFDYCNRGCGNERVEVFAYDEKDWFPFNTEGLGDTGLSGSEFNIRVYDVSWGPNNVSSVYMKGLYLPDFDGRGTYVVLRYRSTEIEPSHSLSSPPPYPTIWDNDENVNPADVVIWYTDAIRQRGTDPTSRSGTASSCRFFC